MRRFKLAKLVRDKIVDLTLDCGNKISYRTLDQPEFVQELKKKIGEETKELLSASGEELVKEIADVQEIIDHFLKALKISKRKLKEIQKKRIHTQGSFKKRLFVDWVETYDEYWTNYYASRPDDFPEVTS